MAAAAYGAVYSSFQNPDQLHVFMKMKIPYGVGIGHSVKPVIGHRIFRLMKDHTLPPKDNILRKLYEIQHDNVKIA